MIILYKKIYEYHSKNNKGELVFNNEYLDKCPLYSLIKASDYATIFPIYIIGSKSIGIYNEETYEKEIKVLAEHLLKKI